MRKLQVFSHEEDFRQELTLILIEETDKYIERQMFHISYRAFAFTVCTTRINNIVGKVTCGVGISRSTYRKMMSVKNILEETPFENNEEIARQMCVGQSCIKNARLWLNLGVQLQTIDNGWIDRHVDCNHDISYPKKDFAI